MQEDINGYTDISEEVCRVIEEELGGKFEGDGWRSFKYNKEYNVK